MHRIKAFSLVELIVVMAVVGVLGALAMTALSGARDRARTTDAVNRLRQIGLAAQMYIAENNGRLPGSQHSGNSWVGGLMPYLGLGSSPTADQLKTVYRSPGDTNRTRLYSYALNDFLIRAPSGAPTLDLTYLVKIERPTQTLLFCESKETYTGSDHFHFARFGYAPAQFASSVAVERYRGGNVYLFVDGRAQWMRWTDVQPLLTSSGSRFVHPMGNP
jgi:prepilin-type N-terminal cleavage/methylation domain-containing protein